MNAHVSKDRFVDQVASIIKYANGNGFDERLKPKAIATGVGEGMPDAGGFLVPTTIADTIWSRIYSTGSILSMCTPQPLTKQTGKVIIPAISETSRADGSRFGGVRSYWVDEGVPPTAAKPKFDGLSMQLRKLLTLIYATDELAEDVPALAAFLERVMALEMQFTIEDKIVNGTGAGQPLGVLNSVALITVAEEGGESSGDLTWPNIQKMAQRLWGPSHAKAVWLMSNDVYGKILGLESSLGLSIFGMLPDGRRTILQMPVMLSEYTPAIGQAGDLLLADFSQYLVLDQQSAMESSIHVSFVTDETAFKLRYRADGQPAWRSPVTPKNSSTTQSPFVALGARP